MSENWGNRVKGALVFRKESYPPTGELSDHAGGLSDVRLPADRRLWVSFEIHPDHGPWYAWRVEALSDDGFNQTALGATSTFWGAKRKVRRYTNQWRKEYRQRGPRA